MLIILIILYDVDGSVQYPANNSAKIINVEDVAKEQGVRKFRSLFSRNYSSGLMIAAEVADVGIWQRGQNSYGRDEPSRLQFMVQHLLDHIHHYFCRFISSVGLII